MRRNFSRSRNQLSAFPQSIKSSEDRDLFAEKTSMMWVWRKSCLQKLTRTILREVAEYIGFTLPLILHRKEGFFIFDQKYLKQESRYSFSEDLAQYNFAYCAIAVVSPNSFLVCGGQYDRSIAHFVDRGKAVALPNMNTGRLYHCAISIREARSVFVFGGWDRNRLSSCEGFRWTTGKWRPISRMNRSRSVFICSLYNDLVYLCRGEPGWSIETYDWKKNHFELIPDSLFPLESGKLVPLIVSGTHLFITAIYFPGRELSRYKGMRTKSIRTAAMNCTESVCVVGEMVFAIKFDSCSSPNSLLASLGSNRHV